LVHFLAHPLLSEKAVARPFSRRAPANTLRLIYENHQGAEPPARVLSSMAMKKVRKAKKALITGSGGLIGSECSRLLCEDGWDVLGIDNDLRRWFFGEAATTQPVVHNLQHRYSAYRHFTIDIRNRQAVRDLFEAERPDFIIHTAAQPSHDKAASIPYDDFDVNAGGTVNLLVAARDFCRESPFCFTSTNKVYGDRPNALSLKELEKRYDYADGRSGIDESMSIDSCLHSLFGASKAAADLMCQEFGRYFQMPVGIFRGGCLTGPQHAAVELHGYLAYIVFCAVTGREYTIYGYKGKQVRDQIHSRDVARLFLEFYTAPKCAEVYNLGGGRANSLSILETIDLLTSLGYKLRYSYNPASRIGDHVCYISDLTKIQKHFPQWRREYDIGRIMNEIVLRYEARMTAEAPNS
jgi:CDP-paratose 2-epimerase